MFEIDQTAYRAAYNQAKAALAKDIATKIYDSTETVRYNELVAKDYVTKEQAGQFEATYLSQVATVAADSAAVATAKFNLDNSTIRAPISGRTGNLLVREGNLVHAASGTSLVLINQIHPIYVQFYLPATNLPDIQKYSAQNKLAVTVYQSATQPNTPPARRARIRRATRPKAPPSPPNGPPSAPLNSGAHRAARPPGHHRRAAPTRAALTRRCPTAPPISTPASAAARRAAASRP